MNEASSDKRECLLSARRLVVKVGSSLLTADGTGLDQQFIGSLTNQLVEQMRAGRQIVLVSSGSIAAGVASLKLPKRPERISDLQAAAAIGQASLIRHYEVACQAHQLQVAQVLLTHADIANRQRYLNARQTLTRLLQMPVLTIVNENDTVATDEIRFGDNDSLAALVCNLIDADGLILLTDQDGLLTADPRVDPEAELIGAARADDESLIHLAGEGGSLGRGGMITKLQAAKIASRSGAFTVITNGRRKQVLRDLVAGHALGTLLTSQARISSKKQWLANQMKIAGAVKLDAGAVEAILARDRSLLAIGVKAVEGEFERGSLISITDLDGAEVARGLSNYSAAQTRQILGKDSEQIKVIFGTGADEELVHRDSLVILA